MTIRDPYHPVTCRCGTHFCKTCIEPIYKKKGPCPMCKEHFESIAANLQMKCTIENKKVYCTYKQGGCTWEGELRNLDSHLMDDSTAAAENCQFYPEPCKYCKAEIPRRLMFDHQSSKCLQRPHQCKFCNNYSSSYTDVTKNHILKCDFAPVRCPNAGCTAPSMLRKDLKQHLSKCPETIITCEFESIGCKYSGPRKDLSRHYQISMPYHMSLIAKHDSMERKALKTKMESELSKLNEELKRAMNAVGIFNQKNAEILQENARLNTEVETLKMELHTQNSIWEKRLLKEGSSLKDESLKNIQERKEETLDECSKKITEQVRRQVSHQMASIKREVKQENASFVTDLNKETDRKLQESFGLVYQDIQTLKDKADVSTRKHSALIKDVEGLTARTSLDGHSQIEYLTKRIEELEDFANITLSSQLGKQPVQVYLREFYKWKVGNGEWISPPFYLDSYKLCLTAFVNGDPQQSAGGHFSLYAHLMRGENDSELPFPFQRTLTLELVHKYNKANNKKQLLPYTRDMMKKYNGRVAGPEDKAKGWGFARFISHAELNSFFHGDPERLIIKVSLS